MNFDGTTYLPGHNAAPMHLGRVLVLGLGKSGKAVARYCLDLLGSRVDAVVIAAGQENEDARAFADDSSARGAQVAFDVYDIEDQFDICIASPGIPQTSPFYQSAAAACTEIVSEVEFAWREARSEARWVAITGTNGKTTTTALCTHLLKTAGCNAVAVGNIGDTCLEAVAADAADIYVAEVSSYQLASTIHFAPDVAVCMNITPDHLSWHGGMEGYIEAKLGMFDRLSTREGAWAILDATNDIVREKVRAMRQQGDSLGYRYLAMGNAHGMTGDMTSSCGAASAAYLDERNQMVVVIDHNKDVLIAASDLQIPGAHNVGNALLAASAALCLGAPITAVQEGLRTFTAPEHRIEACGVVKGVACYNDSKATNVDATLKALAAFDPEQPLVLLGGTDKMTDLDELVREACAHCKAVVLYGASRDRFAEAFADAPIPVLLAEHLEDACDTALDYAQEGDILLLSPACASFDEFTSFEHRGDVFKALVAARGEDA